MLGIGANTAFFSIVNTVVLNPLPYHDPARLVMVWESNPALGALVGPRSGVSWQTFDDWRHQNQVFERMAAFDWFKANLTGLEKPEELLVARATADFFPMLGVQPQLGRMLLPEDEIAGNNHVALLSAGFAERHFAKGNPLGRSFTLDGESFVVAGVLPSSFHMPALYAGINELKPDLWTVLPAMSARDAVAERTRRRLRVAARLKMGVSVEMAKSQMVELTRRLEQQDPTLKGWGVNVFSFEVENIEPDFRTALYLQWAALVVILLMACANVANLTLVRWNARQKEIAVMLALGATRSRVLNRMIVESGLLAGIGWLLGLIAAYLGVRGVVAIRPSEIYEVDRISIDPRAATYSLLLSLLVGVLIGIVPGLLVTRRKDLVSALKNMVQVRRGWQVPRQILVTVEIAMALSLAVGATLLARSFRNVLTAEAGFRSAGVLTAHISLPRQTYGTDEKRLDFFRKLTVALESEPRIRTTGLIDNMPLVAIDPAPFELESRPITKPSGAPVADIANATPEFFEALSIRMKIGRLFTRTEKNVVVINETLARRQWPDQDPMGQHIRRLSPQGPWSTVIGVCADFRQFNMETPVRPEMIWPAEQAQAMTIVAEAANGIAANAFVPMIRQAVWSIDKDQPVADVETLDAIVKRSLSQRRFDTLLINIFSALGIALAAVGIYGMIAYQASSRKRETGVRYALGASRTQVFWSLALSSMTVGIVGVAAGLGSSFLLARALRGLLFGVKAFDLLTYSLMAVAVLVIVVATSGIAAWKGARVDPLTLLRYE
jgi:putative ABC transport system permease protein